MNGNDTQRILIVDDSPDSRHILSKLLECPNYVIETAESGEEALARIRTNAPDLILLDMVMPGIDGLEVCRRIKDAEETRDIPVLFATGLTDEWNKKQAFEAGGVDYIVKPFMPEEVLARVHTHLMLKKSMERLERASVTDELTGAYNRRFAYKMLAKHIAAAKRRQENFVVCYIDVDGLKTINDTYGHEHGDLLITTVVNSLSAGIRSSDYLFRMGGDEFLVLFPNAEREHVDRLMTRLQQELNREQVQGIPVDFSFGFAEFRHYEDGGIDDLISAADESMYAAKMEKKGKGGTR